MTNDTLCLIRDDLKAKAASVGVEKAHASNMDFWDSSLLPLIQSVLWLLKEGSGFPCQASLLSLVYAIRR